MYHIVETAFASVVQYGILLLEIVGAGIILISSVRALDALLRLKALRDFCSGRRIGGSA